ncbi:hypothetical protein GCM10008014_38820 [Paenibacillus silvae]|uniref:Uncharacterized protein n=1 Tax=Paenibacillus silvae TaxID=1325358 RepID=A0ABQ1ZHW2_9BACL|nr:hypothetical protein GCM10008014_38820 [Paenibacillus silvae]
MQCSRSKIMKIKNCSNRKKTLSLYKEARNKAVANPQSLVQDGLGELWVVKERIQIYENIVRL